ncbi:hypothetical protein [Bradyrhizobium sp. SZCCHNRI2010]|uniref:hypothetical protein n=1 Tax=Bradyrhizobium sp. SZCCHNRI2010 TaxID=3057283 RepID=UPI0028E85D1D|nr:hypothetical protein [Bradyrhizobium sp. SZCCHNRI2010]
METTSCSVREDRARTEAAIRTPVRPDKQAFLCLTFGEPWTIAEDDILRDNRHLSGKELMNLLPERTEKAIFARSRRLGVYKTWDRHEKTVLFDNPHLTARELMALLPGRSLKAIQNQRDQLGLTFVRNTRERPRRSLMRSGNPVVDAIITRCEEDHIGLKSLDREIGTGHYFQSHPKTVKLEHVAKAIAFFGGRGLLVDGAGNVTIDWADE